MFYPCYLFLFFSFLPLRSPNQWMAAHKYVLNSWGYGVILISHDWIFRLIPLFLGNVQKLPQILSKNDDALIWRVVIYKRLNLWKWENRGIVALHFLWKLHKSPFTYFWGRTAGMLGVASELLLAVAFHAIAAIWFYFTSASLFSTHTHTTV